MQNASELAYLCGQKELLLTIPLTTIAFMHLWDCDQSSHW